MTTFIATVSLTVEAPDEDTARRVTTYIVRDLADRDFEIATVTGTLDAVVAR